MLAARIKMRTPRSPKTLHEIPLHDIKAVVCTEHVENHRVRVFQRKSKFLLLLPVNSGTTLLRSKRRRKYVSVFYDRKSHAHTADFSKAAQEEEFGETLRFVASYIIGFYSIRLFVGDIERQSSCEISTYFARIPK